MPAPAMESALGPRGTAWKELNSAMGTRAMLAAAFLA